MKNYTCQIAPIAVKILPIFLREIATNSGRNGLENTEISAPKNLKTAF
jgi:hypothetical protein